MKKFILQAVQDEDHIESAREVFGLPDLGSAIISTAFMSSAGLSLLEPVLIPIADRTRLFVGIRNGVTTVQSIQKALDIGCETYLVDTGIRQRIFHPKLCYARSPTLAKLLLGSANLTMGGLRTNIEASVMQTLDPESVDDAGLMDDLEAKLNGMIVDYPDNVIRVREAAQLVALLSAGRLVDERVVRSSEPAGSSSDRDLDTVPRMQLYTSPIKTAALAPPPRNPAGPVVAGLAAAPALAEDMTLTWISKPLKRAHISLPNQAGTNPKGSMSLTVGLFEGIDQRHYFRDEVFAGLNWVPDVKYAYKERTTAIVKVVVKGINYGRHALRLSHDTRTDTASYEQNNYMTSLHWGDTVEYVAREDVLGSTLRLFREIEDPTSFTLEID